LVYDEEIMSSQGGERLHGLLTAALVSDLALSFAEVTEADHVGTLAEPQAIAGHRPDVVARTDETLIIGEAKLVPRADDHSFVEQLRAWHEYLPSGFQRAILTLAVPAGARESAEAAAETAGWDQDDLRVLEVGLPQHVVAG
jgi:hypothetical protein